MQWRVRALCEPWLRTARACGPRSAKRSTHTWRPGSMVPSSATTYGALASARRTSGRAPSWPLRLSVNVPPPRAYAGAEMRSSPRSCIAACAQQSSEKACSTGTPSWSRHAAPRSRHSEETRARWRQQTVAGSGWAMPSACSTCTGAVFAQRGRMGHWVQHSHASASRATPPCAPCSRHAHTTPPLAGVCSWPAARAISLRPSAGSEAHQPARRPIAMQRRSSSSSLELLLVCMSDERDAASASCSS
jgi:hypothetical protein